MQKLAVGRHSSTHSSGQAGQLSSGSVRVPPCIGHRAGACTPRHLGGGSSHPPCLGRAGCKAGHRAPAAHGHQPASQVPRVSLRAAEISPFCMRLVSQCNPQKHRVSGLLQSSNSAPLSLCSGSPKGNSARERPRRGAPGGEESPPVTQHQPRLPRRDSAAT